MGENPVFWTRERLFALLLRYDSRFRLLAQLGQNFLMPVTSTLPQAWQSFLITIVARRYFLGIVPGNSGL
jgi:hypothetical protein